MYNVLTRSVIQKKKKNYNRITGIIHRKIESGRPFI